MVQPFAGMRGGRGQALKGGLRGMSRGVETSWASAVQVAEGWGPLVCAAPWSADCPSLAPVIRPRLLSLLPPAAAHCSLLSRPLQGSLLCSAFLGSLSREPRRLHCLARPEPPSLTTP